MAVCLSVRVLPIWPKDIIKQALPHNSLRNLVFWRQRPWQNSSVVTPMGGAKYTSDMLK